GRPSRGEASRDRRRLGVVTLWLAPELWRSVRIAKRWVMDTRVLCLAAITLMDAIPCVADQVGQPRPAATRSGEYRPELALSVAGPDRRKAVRGRSDRSSDPTGGPQAAIRVI